MACIDAGELTVPLPFAGLHVQEVIIETLEAARVGRFALFAIRQKAQRGERAQRGCVALDEIAARADEICPERHADRCDARWPVRRGLVQNQAIAGIGFVEEVAEGVALQPVQRAGVE
jgi:hypothetical protein